LGRPAGRVGLGWIGSGWVEILQFLMGWVEYDDYSKYNCIPVEFLGSSGKVCILIICAVRCSLLYGYENCDYVFKYDRH